MNPRLKSFCFALIGLLPLAANALDPKDRAAVAPLSSPDGTSNVANLVSIASIQAGTSDTKATVSLAGFLPDIGPGRYLSYQVQGAAPVSSKDSTDETDIGTVSGLTAGASAHAGMSLILWPHQQPSVVKSLRMVCEQDFGNLIPGYEWKDLPSSGVSGVGCNRGLFKVDTLKAIAAGLQASLDQCNKKAPKQGAKAPDYKPTPLDCQRLAGHPDPVALSDLAKDQDQLDKSIGVEQVDFYERRAMPLQMITVGVTANRQKAQYFNKSDLTTLQNDHTTGYGVDLSYSHIQYNLMYAVGASYEKTFKSGSQVQVCSPISGSTSTKCLTGAIGAPNDKFSRIAFTEARYLVIGGVLAVAPRLEYDFTASQFAAKLPIYLAPDKNKVLTGGVSLGYVSHGGGGFGASVFVGKAFSFFD